MELMVLVALVAVLISALWKKVWVELIWRPYTMTEAMRKQGVRGPAYKFWKGSFDEFMAIDGAAKDVVLDKRSHDTTVRALPFFGIWTEQYGSPFLFWIGAQPIMAITDPEMIKEVLTDRTRCFTRFEPNLNLFALLGRGLNLLDGEEWARHRKIINPAFATERIKMMINQMAECAKVILQRWHDQTLEAKNEYKEIEVYQDFQELAMDVIAHEAFGSSYEEQRDIFLAQKKLVDFLVENSFQSQIPGFKNLPTKKNLYKWGLQRTLKDKIQVLIQQRLINSRNGDQYGNDLLGILIEASQKKMLSTDEMIDECKTFLFTGHSTISALLAWAMYLLSIYPDWQDKLREEVLRECGTGELPTADSLSRLKLVTMFICETVRLYTPALVIGRKIIKDATLGGGKLKIPRGTGLFMPLPVIHRVEEVWGADAKEFNPRRFENGVSRAATHPNAMLSFGAGPKVCIGQSLAMQEAKVVLAMILQRFSFSISPNYKHVPEMYMLLRPKHGVPIIFQAFD